MATMKRKIIKQGNNTLTITLPRSWTDNYGLKSGDELELELKGNSLVLSVDKLLTFGKKTQDVSKLVSILPIVLLSLYRKGYDDVELTFENPHTSVIIQNILRDGATGYHMIEHAKSSCILKSLAELSGIDFNEMLRKLFIMEKIKVESINDAIEKNDTHVLQTILAMSSTPAKVSNFCHRLIAKMNIKEAEKATHLYLIVNNLENLDSQLNLLVNLLLNASLNINSKQILGIISEFKGIFSDFYSSYYESNISKIIPVINRKNALNARIQAISDELSNDESRIFLNLNNSLIYFNDIVNAALVMML